MWEWREILRRDSVCWGGMLEGEMLDAGERDVGGRDAGCLGRDVGVALWPAEIGRAHV